MLLNYPYTLFSVILSLWHYLFGALEMDMFATPSKPIRYPWWKRLWRIYRFLRRQKRKRKQEQRRKKKEKRDQQKAASRWRKKVKRRARRMAFKRWLRPKRKSKEEIREAKRLKKIQQKAYKRKRRVFFKSLFSPRPIDTKQLEKKRLLKQEQEFLDYKRRRIRRFILKRYRQIIWDVLRGKGLPPKRGTHKKRPNIWLQILGKEYVVIMLNSLMAFLIAYYFIMLSSKIASSVAALFFDIASVIYNGQISFIVIGDSGWSFDAIKTIFSAGPVIAMLIGLISILIFSQVYAERGVLKLVLLWISFHGFNQIIMGTLVGSLMGQGMGYVVMYSYFMDTGKFILSVVMFVLALVLGWIFIRVWIQTANSYYTCSLSKDRPQFILVQVFFPYFIGNIIVLLVTLPDFNLFETVVNLSLLVFLMPTLFGASKQPDSFFEVEEDIDVRWRYKMFIFAIIFIVGIRYVLHFGIHFG